MQNADPQYRVRGLMHLHLRKFVMASVATDATVAVIGKRRCGKTFLVCDLLYQHHRELSIGAVISHSDYSAIVPPRFIHQEYTGSERRHCDGTLSYQADTTMNLAEHVLEQQRRRRQPVEAAAADCPVLVLDDCLYDTACTRDRNLRYLFGGRCMCVITLPYPMDLSPDLRTTIDYVFILRENMVNNRRHVYERYAGGTGGTFPTLDVFCQVMDQCTQNYGCLVIDNRCKSDRIEDKVFWYVAERRPQFRIAHDDTNTPPRCSTPPRSAPAASRQPGTLEL
jgi:hypothetical protein